MLRESLLWLKFSHGKVEVVVELYFFSGFCGAIYSLACTRRQLSINLAVTPNLCQGKVYFGWNFHMEKKKL